MARKHKCKLFFTFKFLLINSSNVLVSFSCTQFLFLAIVQHYLEGDFVFPVQIDKDVKLQMIRPYFHVLAHYHHYCQPLPELWTYSNHEAINSFMFQLHIEKFFCIVFSKSYISRDVSFLQILLFNFTHFLSNIKIFSSMYFYESVFITFISYGKTICFH